MKPRAIKILLRGFPHGRKWQEQEVGKLFRISVLPEGVIRLPDLTIGGIKSKELGKLLIANGYRVSDYAGDLMKKMPTLKDQKQ